MRELRRWSPSDAEAYDDFGRLMFEMAKFVKPILSMTPPDPGRFRPREWTPVARLARAFKELPREQQAVFIQLMTMSAADFLDQWFETDPLKATMSASGIIGTFQGIRSPGTAYVLLHHYMGEIDGVLRAWGIPRGGTGGVSTAIAEAARSLGVEIRTEEPVEQFLLRGDDVVGAVTSSGEEVTGRVVLSSLDPRQTFARLVPPGHLDSSFLEDVARYRYRGSSGKVNLALDGLPDFTCLPGEGDHLRGAISFSPSIDYMERAYDDAKAGRFSRRPYIDMIIPTIVDPSMAPPGKHVMSCFVQYAPYRLADGGEWDDARRDEFGATVIDTIAERAPNIRDLILHAQVLTPKDIEERFGLSEGNIFQGELSLEQLFFNRPEPGWARYRTPLRNLWLCGSATHPGGGIMGASGRLAALQVVRSLRAGKAA
jgi:phytoene dehydrogenase-like protein